MHKSSDVRSSINLRQAVAVILAISAASQVMHIAAAEEAKKADDVATLSDVDVADDPLRAMSNEPSASSFGFAKPLLETPRSVSFVSEEQLSKFGIQSVQDLTRLVPGTYTTTRYGLQGAINVRTVTADQYYRGMKRIDQQGHVRTVLSAYDNIEVVKGPPSPVFGMGRIGGYTVLDPKSSRARTGKYMTKSTGYVQGLTGSYKLGEIQLGEGIPFSIAGRAAGLYAVALLENSEGWIKNVGAQQKFLQVTSSVDRAVGPFRLETGGQLQNSITSGSYMNRGTQALVNNGTYISGQPMVNLDANGDGRIGYLETYLKSPITGAAGAANSPLSQRFNWAQDSSGNPIPLSTYKDSITGVPTTFINYLKTPAGLALTCPLANAMRNYTNSSGVGAATVTGGVTTAAKINTYPQGFFLNPCTVKKQQVDYRANGSFERQQNAVQRMGYADLIYDTDPNFTVKQQFFYDSIDSFKDSWLPYGERQYIKAFEDKVTVTKRLPGEWLPSWMAVNTLGSVNYRDTRGFIRSSSGDFDYRQDVMFTTGAGNVWEGSGTGGMYPNTMFWSQLTNASYATGAPVDRYLNSQYSEQGIGLMFDIDLFKHLNLVLGGRTDNVSAETSTPTVFNRTTGTFTPTQEIIDNYVNGVTAAGFACLNPGDVVEATPAVGATPATYATCPGGTTAATHNKASQSAMSWSTSIGYQLPWGNMRPYFTAASSSLALDGSNSLFANTVLAGGKIIGKAALRELGIKGAFWRGKAQWTLDAFRQTRNDVSSPSDPTLSAEVTSTLTKGIESDIKLQPTKKLFLTASLVYMDSRYLSGGINTTTEVDGRDLGFQDFVAPNGDVYPAEAYLYGGRTSLQYTDPNNVYDKVPGNPDWQGAASATYQLPMGFGILLSSQYLSQSWANRIQTVKLPQVTLYDAGVTYDVGNLHLRFSEYNLTDERYFQQGQSTNAVLLTVMPGRRWQFQMKAEF